jgi:hypothetical protein
MKKINFLVMLLLVATVSAQAQVTIGDTKISSPFSILELISDRNDNGYRGLRLPQLTTEERKAMQETNDFQNEKTDNAMGLQIYNTTTRCVETWNGSGWIQSCGQYGPRPTTGKLAYRTSGSGAISGWIEFMSYNLGATEMSIKDQLLFASSTFTGDPTSHQDALAANFKPVYGDLYQWGRKTDGHQNVWSAITATLATNPSDAGTDNFIASSSDWTSTPDNTLWDGEVSANNPCPPGFHVPSQDEWSGIVKGSSTSEYLTVSSKVGYGVNKWVWVDGTQTLAALGVESGNLSTPNTKGYLIYPPASTYNFEDGYGNEDYQTTPTFFLPAAGNRSYNNGLLDYAGTLGYYWSSTVNGTNAYDTYIASGLVIPVLNTNRAYGLSVRCLSE